MPLMQTYIDPKQFIITRKRKKYRFAKFNNSPLCFEFEQWQPRAADSIEIGAGNGMFAVEQAARFPNKTFVAVDVKGDRLQKGAYEAQSRGLTNVVFLRARADQLLELFPQSSAMEIWVTFADPFPKNRSAGRRLTHPYYLALYQQVLRKNGSLCVKHDNQQFFAWSLEQLVSDGWVLKELSFDLHESQLEDHYKIMTAYEERWLAEGLKTHFTRAQPPRTRRTLPRKVR